MDFVRFFDGSGCTFPNAPEALDSNECAQQSQKTFQWRERGGGREGERREMMEFRLNDREAKTAFPLSALIVG